MVSRRKETEKPSNSSLKNRNKKSKHALAPNKPDEAKKRSKTKKKQRLIKTNENKRNDDDRVEEQNDNNKNDNNEVIQALASTQVRLFLDRFQSATGVQLSSLELESIKDTCILELSQCSDEDAKSLGNNMKVAFGPS